MLNYIWGAMMLLSLIISLFTGKTEATVAAASEGAALAVQSCITLLGILCLWRGLSLIGEKAGMIDALAKGLSPVLTKLFPTLSKEDKARGAIVMNLVANILGMGNAATPLGIHAMETLKEKEQTKRASNAMCMLVVLNTASLQLMPTTLLSLRQAYGSVAAGCILLPVWISGLGSLLVGILGVKILERRM